MIFTQSQIEDMLSILKKYELIFIGKQIGLDFLSSYDKTILSASGIDVNAFKDKKGIIEHAFLFGILSEAIGDKRAKKMNYTQFQRFLSSENFIPLNKEEEFALQTVKQRAYTDICNLTNKMKNGISNIVLKNNQQSSLLAQKIVRKKTVEAIELRAGARSLASSLGTISQNWETDWLRIAYYLTHEAYNSGRSQGILKQYGADSEVYFDVYPKACEHCKKLYLIDPSDDNSEPIVFQLQDIISNGNNIGRKVSEWLPTISPTHPYCRCTINHKKPGFAWDTDLRAFTIPIKKKSNHSKLKDVKLNIKITKAENSTKLNIENRQEYKEIEKGKHFVGEKHPTQPWIWTEYKSGKFDWRLDKHSKVYKNTKNETKFNLDEIKRKQSKKVTPTNLIENLLQKLEPFIKEIISRQNKKSIKETGYPLNKYDIEYTRLIVTFDLIKSIEIYTEPTDTILSLKSQVSIKGNLEIKGKIKRNDKVYDYSTEVITAEGPVQNLHYRYLTHTNLPRTNNQEKTKELDAKIKKMTKFKKLDNEILENEQKIKETEKILKVNKTKTSKQIWDEISKNEYANFLKLDWEEVVRRGATQNYNNSEEEFNKRQKEDIERLKNSWYKQNIKWKEEYITALKQNIKKIKEKIETLKK